MRVLVLFVVAAVLAAVPASTFGASRTTTRSVNPSQELAVSVQKAADQFALDVYSQLGKSKSENLFFSPSSISITLAMAAAGARGQTQAEMANVLCLGNNLDGAHAQYGLWLTDWNATPSGRHDEIRVANRLWVQVGYPLVESYVALTSRDYGAEIGPLDFKADPEACRLTINEWVERQTANKIEDLLPPNSIEKNARLVLTNAVYFKGEWYSPFEKSETRDEDFSVSGTRKVKVPMMHQKDTCQYYETPALQVLQMPYQRFHSMIVVLPRKNDGLAALERTLSAGQLQQWISGMSRREVDVTLPKFKMETSYELGDTLKAMGMKLALSPSGADFSGISGKEDLHISSVVHKAYIDVNEEGTEAAAATGAIMGMGAMGMQPPPMATFRADHPFLFVIWDMTNHCPLFLGRVANPQG